jgi:hypothetical protein
MFLFCFGERKNFSVSLNRIGLKFEFHRAHANIFISRHPLSIINNIQIYLLKPRSDYSLFERFTYYV